MINISIYPAKITQSCAWIYVFAVCVYVCACVCVRTCVCAIILHAWVKPYKLVFMHAFVSLGLAGHLHLVDWTS